MPVVGSWAPPYARSLAHPAGRRRLAAGRSEPGAVQRDQHAFRGLRPHAGLVTRPWPPTGAVTVLLLNPAISGRPLAMAAFTTGSCSEAVWLAWLSQASVIQMPFGSAGSVATT